MVVMDLRKKNRLFICLFALFVATPLSNLFGEDSGVMPSALQAEQTPAAQKQPIDANQDVIDAETQKIIDSHETPTAPQSDSTQTLPNKSDNESEKTLVAPTQQIDSADSQAQQDIAAFPLNNNTSEKETKSAPSKKATQKKNIYLNFENTSLANFVNYIAEMKKLNLIPDKTLADSKVSLSIRDPLTPDGAWTVFLTVLEMGGFTIVKVGDVHKVIPKDQKLTQPLPVYINVPVETLPDSDLVIRYVTFLQNLNVDSVAELLNSMLSEKHAVIAQKEVNGFVITDKSYNIKSAVKLLKELDQTGQSEVVVVIKLKTTNAKDVEELLKSLIKQPDGNPLARLLGQPKKGTTDYFPPGTRIIAEPRTNSLILLGAIDSIKKIEDFIVNNVDTDLKEAESPLHIYELQYTDAGQIASILKEVTGPPDSGPGQDASKFGAIRGGVKYFKGMNFQVDKDGNRLIVASTDKEDWELLKQTIQDLDKPQPQVAIETYFVSVSANEGKRLGGAIRNKKHGQLGKGVDFQSAALSNNGASLNTVNGSSTSLLGNMVSQLVRQQGSTLLSFGKSTNIWAVLQAFKSEGNTSILSQPFVTVANKTKATIDIGQEVQVVQENTSSGQPGFAAVSVSTSVEVEPQINLDGILRLDVNVNIGDFTNQEKGEKQTKILKTNVTMADGQVLVLGGFVQTKVSEDLVKTPFFGEIPILGWLFKSQQRTINKSYVFIFLCPTIIKPRTIPGIGLYTKMKMHQATDQIESSILTNKSTDPVFNWFFDPKKENYSHKVVDFANARYQPTTVDIKNDPYYRVHTQYKDAEKIALNDNQLGTTPMPTSIQIDQTVKPENAITEAQAPSIQTKTTEQPKLQFQPTQVSPQIQVQLTSTPPVDTSLQQKRDLLKAMVTQANQPASQPQQSTHQPESTQQEKISSLKELISSLPTPDNQPMNINIDPEKRKNLKQLLSMREQHAQP